MDEVIDLFFDFNHLFLLNECHVSGGRYRIFFCNGSHIRLSTEQWGFRGPTKVTEFFLRDFRRFFVCQVKDRQGKNRKEEWFSGYGLSKRGLVNEERASSSVSPPVRFASEVVAIRAGE